MIVHDTYEQKETCSGCMACAQECPTSCINHIIDDEGFMYPKVDLSMCINCDHCVKMCPFTHPDEYKMTPIVCYAAWSQTKDTRFESATAGVFTALAQDFIAKGGVVYGAAYDEDMHLDHIRAESLADLKRIQSSKYVQSDFSKIYKQIQTDINNNLQVMVSGTGCQIAGIRAALKCDNLTLIDITCLGVPSPGVFEKYVDSLQIKHGKRVRDINFRDKSSGWKTYSQTVTFDDGEKESCLSHKSAYMRGFLDKIYMRPSCYKCPFCDSLRVGDITIGDFWGIEKTLPQLDDVRGVSLVYAVTDKGQKALDACRDIIKHECTMKDTLQQSLVRPADASPKRAAFFREFKKKSFDQLAKKYMKQRSRIVQIAVNMLKY